MSITVLQLDEAAVAYDLLCERNFKDTDVDTIASSVIAKNFDTAIEYCLDEWLYISPDFLSSHLAELKKGDEYDDALIAVHELLYEIHDGYGHLGLIIRVALLDHRGNLLVQTEEIDNVSYRFYVDTKNSVV